MHPLSGLDHLAAMIAVGLWAAMLGGRAVWAVPASFVGMMVAGAALGLSGIQLPAVELMIGLSVVALGLVAALQLRVPTPVAAVVVAAFALFHGAAHGAEMPGFADPLLYGLGFVLATSLLHGVGLALGFGIARTSAANWVIRAVGVAFAALGLSLLAG